MPAATETVASTEAIAPFGSGGEHLLAELERLSLLLHAEILRMRAANQLTDNQFRGLYVPDEQIDALRESGASENVAGLDARSAMPALAGIERDIAECEQRIRARCRASSMTGLALPLERLTVIYSLSWQERDALLLTVAAEVDARFETLYSYAQNDVTRKRPTVGLVLRLLGTNAGERLELRSLFSADSRLLHTPLLRVADEGTERESALLSRSLRPEERIVDFLLERDAVDSRLAGFTTCPSESARALASLHFGKALAEELQQAAAILRQRGGVLFFHGPTGSGKRTVAEALSAETGRSLVIADIRRAFGAGIANPATLGLLRREARLRGANLLLTNVDAWVNEEGTQNRQSVSIAQPLRDFAEGFSIDESPRVPAQAVLFIASESPWPPSAGAQPVSWTAFEFPVPDFSCRTRLWQEAIAAAGAGNQPTMAVELANQFILTGGQIHAACRMARTQEQLFGRDSATLTSVDFQATARAQSNQSLRRRAQKVDAIFSWTDLVLPSRTLQQLREVCAAEKYRSFVFAEWGFDRRLAQRKGLNILFCGPSGTGKTMSAGIVARELALDLYKIDLSSVISKYIGETEKHLNEIFREAQSSNAILFFDEADAIFGKRSEVKDAHDRYANVEVAYLLQKMEEYEGVVILATNFRKNIDDAFTRRIQYIVEFPFPEAKYRERIWRGLIPAGAPLAKDVDFGFLARQFELAGGSIRNAALVAAYLGAEEGGELRMEHFVLATARELQKMGKAPTRSDFKEYYDLTRERI
jgi:SpoVK/Ycf46/Vps4 family AAA+-type ATPase